MCNVLRFLAIGTAALIATAYAAFPNSAAVPGRGVGLSEATAAVRVTPVDRSRKGDRLAVAAQVSGKTAPIATVEVIGLQDAVVIYKARDGRVLFHADPTMSATTAVKGVILPDVTIRDVRSAPTEVRPPASKPPPVPAAVVKDQKILDGCDPAFSPLTASSRVNFSGRCVAAAPALTQVAAVY